MAGKKILVVDDERDILELVEVNLEQEGYQTITARTGEGGLRKARMEEPDLIILDLMLPGIDGLEVCKRLKNEGDTSHIPVIMLTAKGDESDIVTGLELGADDYITKPFSPKVLVARVRKSLRRFKSEQESEDKIKIDGLTIDKSRHKVLVDNQPVELTLTEFNILLALARRPGMVFTRYQIVDAVKGQDYPVTDRAVDVQIVSLRKKLGKYGQYIQTVRGVGYRFKDSK